ncbi:MAG TPA: hypothetical protein DCM08_09890 [Microscillaceae bacterium]|nr:hypothetical protein [Microscillaceae bacterium]
MQHLWAVSLRQSAIFIPNALLKAEAAYALRGTTATLVANMAQLGFGVDENLLHQLNRMLPPDQLELLAALREISGVNKNWTPLVKGWDVPTGETVVDHIMTFFANVFGARGTTLPCGHIIPPGTFPLERYNGCPFCGTPFAQGSLEKIGQGSTLKLLRHWSEADLEFFFTDLLTSKTALDATQMDSLHILLAHFPLPASVDIKMKETLMAVVDALLEKGQAAQVERFFQSPTDILRYLWYKHTGFLQIIEPQVVIRRKAANARHIWKLADRSEEAYQAAKQALKLKYSRKQSVVVARWLNNLAMPAEQICETMHPKRNIWVRFIRALRLAEYAKRSGFDKLKEVLDLFYRRDYPVWQGRLSEVRLRLDEAQTLSLLKQRPGLFARSLFAQMLWFGPDNVVKAFAEIIDKVPARLVFTLQMYARNYFNPAQMRSVKPLGGKQKHIPANPLLKLYSPEQCQAMQAAVAELCVLAIERRFAAIPTDKKTMYIDPQLYKMPLAIGDRSEQVQDRPVALMGTRFAVEGNTVRLFMQWGEGLPAQHLDMDLSCHIAYDKTSDICSYSKLTAVGCQHSGDIRQIPEMVGTAEYIEIDLPTLEKAGARYVTFTCNAYSRGEITPNMVLGWMSSQHPMHISETTGVAYDPSCVQQQIRITQGLHKGLVFGVLEVATREVIWLEMSYGGQVVQGLSFEGVKALLAKLSSKINIGYLLGIKAKAQNLTLVDDPTQADEVYTVDWAINSAAVTKLLVD